MTEPSKKSNSSTRLKPDLLIEEALRKPNPSAIDLQFLANAVVRFKSKILLNAVLDASDRTSQYRNYTDAVDGVKDLMMRNSSWRKVNQHDWMNLLRAYKYILRRPYSSTNHEHEIFNYYHALIDNKWIPIPKLEFFKRIRVLRGASNKKDYVRILNQIANTRIKYD